MDITTLKFIAFEGVYEGNKFFSHNKYTKDLYFKGVQLTSKKPEIEVYEGVVIEGNGDIHAAVYNKQTEETRYIKLT